MIQVARRNIWRNKTRSIIIILTITIGVIGGTFCVAFYNGLLLQRIESVIGNEIANIQIHSLHFIENKDITDSISKTENIQSIIDTISVLKGYSIRFKIMAMINSATHSSGIIVLGIDPQAELKTTNIAKLIKEGNFLDLYKKNTVLIGQKLAEKLNVQLHSQVIITFQNLNGNLVTAAYKVEGIYNTGNTSFDERMVYIKKNDILPIATNGKNIAHEIAIALYNDAYSTTLVKKLRKIFSFVEINTWKELYPELGLMTNYANYLQLIFMIIIFLAFSFGIINTMLMAVMERTQEFGMFMAIGMNKTRIFQMICYETFLLMFTGTILGLIISYILITFYGIKGVNLSAFSQGFNQMGFHAIVYPVITFREALHIVILVLISSLFSSLIPIRKALKISPSKVLNK